MTGGRQRTLWEPPAPDPDDVPEPPEGPARWIRFGTSSFSWKDWVGPFYPEGTPSSDYLAHYATRFDTVEVDATYYRIPSASTVEGWARKTPEDFLVAAKWPRSVVHGGEGRRPDGDRVISEAVREERDRFLEVMSLLGSRLGPLVLQFPYFNKEAFDSQGPFLERLDGFLEELPGEFPIAVEVRNRRWVNDDLAAVCADRGAGLVLVDQQWMPHGDRVVESLENPIPGDHCYVRLLGNRDEIEEVTTTWDEEVLDRTDRLERWADLLADLAERRVPCLVYANNRYAGHGPATARRLRGMVRERLEG